MKAAGRRAEQRVDDAADFLRRLSIADAKVLLERTRKERENKTKEMQKMIGVRYRDLIESADKIVNMHSAALRLEVSLKEMPEMWKEMEMSLIKALTSEMQRDDDTINAVEVDAEKEVVCDAVADKVAFLVEVPEKMWQLLDEGKSLEALVLYQEACKVHEECTKRTAEHEYPFLQTQWACIQCFHSRMIACAKSFLTCRGNQSRFYADNLCTLAVLNDPRLGADALLELFLESRSKWMSSAYKTSRDKQLAQPPLKKERVLMLILKTINMTMTQTEEIFGDGSSSSLLSAISQLPSRIKEEVEEYVSSGKLLKRMSMWFQEQQRQVVEVTWPLISSIDSISLLSQAQSKLYAVNELSGSCQSVKLWHQVLQSSESESFEKKVTDSVESVFAVLYAEAFRKRTRDLVQNSFVEALETIKTRIRESLEDTVTGISRRDYRLKNVKFYDYFETIQKKAADLDASDLQSVLTEEFLRTLFKLVVFFEQEYPLPGSQLCGATKPGAQLPHVFFNIANTFAGIVAEFPRQMAKLFPGDSSTCAIPERDSPLLSIESTFVKYAKDGFVEKTQLAFVFEELFGGKNNVQVCFIDEELQRVDCLGRYSLYLASEIKQKAAYPQMFVNVLHGLSVKYCEAWAAILLEEKIEPLRELMQIEQYTSTNEEWIATHEGWAEQVISNEGLEEDTDDSSSDPEITLGDEKVWLPWCETPTVSSFLFSCCYSLDDANRLIQNAVGAKDEQVKLLQRTVRNVLVEQLTIASVAVYDAAVSLLVQAKASQSDSVLNFGECCIQQFLFDMYFVRATLGFSDFIRFGWGDELNPEDCSLGLLKLKDLFERMRAFIDPVDWEIYGPQLIENVVLQFRKSRLLFSSLSESNDINKINGKEIVIGAQDTRPLTRIAEPVARFSLLPVPSNRRRFQRTVSRSSEVDTAESKGRTNSTSLFYERTEGDDESVLQSSSMKVPNLLSSSTSSNLMSAAASGTNLLSSAAKGIGFLSSATSNRYF